MSRNDELTPNITFEMLCELEPRMAQLYRRAKAIKDDKRKPSFCANAAWYGRRGWPGLKPQLYKLVGWGAKHRGAAPELCTSRAYDIAYRKIYDVLPPCRDCVCWGFQDIIDEAMGA